MATVHARTEQTWKDTDQFKPDIAFLDTWFSQGRRTCCICYKAESMQVCEKRWDIGPLEFKI